MDEIEMNETKELINNYDAIECFVRIRWIRTKSNDFDEEQNNQNGRKIKNVWIAQFKNEKELMKMKVFFSVNRDLVVVSLLEAAQNLFKQRPNISSSSQANFFQWFCSRLFEFSVYGTQLSFRYNGISI